MTVRTVVSLLLILGMATTLFGQTEDAKIKDIREKCRAISSDTGYLIKTLTNEQFLGHVTDGGGELTGYFKNGQIKRIIERVGFSYCVRTFEYYFYDGQLIFVYEKEEDFPYAESTGALDYIKLELAFEGRYYFGNGKMIETKITGQKRIGDDANTDRERGLLAAARRNIDLLKR